jgi:hypothetical protein
MRRMGGGRASLWLAHLLSLCVFGIASVSNWRRIGVVAGLDSEARWPVIRPPHVS